jgi:transcriptional regulator with XRE-family HTH domain
MVKWQSNWVYLIGRPIGRPIKSPVNITQKDIAAKLGVSNQLVSYALNGTGTVSDQMRQRIVATAAELGYRPNTSARVMKTWTLRLHWDLDEHHQKSQRSAEPFDGRHSR